MIPQYPREGRDIPARSPGNPRSTAAAGNPGADRVEVEIGCGNGHFLSEYAFRRTEIRLIGIDRKQKRCVKARQKAEKRGLGNVSVVQEEAEKVLREMRPGSIDAFHVYFPDPWPKSRHRKRRFFTMENLRLMHEALKIGGKLHFGTDFFDYYIQAKVLVALHAGFRLMAEAAPPEIRSSLYARKFSGVQKAIHLFSAVRLSSINEEVEQQEEKRDVHRHVQADENRRDDLVETGDAAARH